jgi:hypothetical protein
MDFNRRHAARAAGNIWIDYFFSAAYLEDQNKSLISG